MKLSDMRKYLKDEYNTIGFLHHTEHTYLQTYDINTRSQNFNAVITDIISKYESKVITNKKASELINICVNANSLTKY